MLEKSPFVDFVENFKKEYGIELILNEDVQNYFEHYAHQNNLQISETLKKFLFGASALNYMGLEGYIISLKRWLRMRSISINCLRDGMKTKKNKSIDTPKVLTLYLFQIISNSNSFYIL
jgi:hypothetical protein